LTKYKPWVDKVWSKLLDQRKQAKLQFLHDPSEINGDNLNNVRHEASRYFRNKKRECLKNKINQLATNSKNKNIRDLYRGIIGFKGGYQLRNSLVKDENGDLLADSHNIFTEINGTHQLLTYTDVVNLLGDNIDTIKKNTETLIDASKEVGLEIDVEKTKYMLLSCYQYVGQNWDIKIANTSFEIVLQFKYLGMTVTNQNVIQEEIKRRLNSGNACYQSVQNLLSSHLLSTT
jgi:hypothetical protein